MSGVLTCRHRFARRLVAQPLLTDFTDASAQRINFLNPIAGVIVDEGPAVTQRTDAPRQQFIVIRFIAPVANAYIQELCEQLYQAK